MVLKRRFNEQERFGLTTEEINEGEKYLRKHKTAGAIPRDQAMILYELFMVGMTFREIAQQYRQYELGQIILTAALRGWVQDREKIIMTIRERVQTTVLKSILEQVDFLTAMLSVSGAEHLESMRAYIRDPENNPKPEMRIGSIKEYKEVLESLQKLLSGANGTKGHGVELFKLADNRPQPPVRAIPASTDNSVVNLLDAEMVDDDE